MGALGVKHGLAMGPRTFDNKNRKRQRIWILFRLVNDERTGTHENKNKQSKRIPSRQRGASRQVRLLSLLRTDIMHMFYRYN